MNIQTHCQGFDMTPAIRAHVLKQMNFNLSNFAGQVVTVDVYLRDVNGPKGGRDKRTLIRIQLASRLSVKVERTRSDLYVATTLAARQAKRAVKRTLNKHRRMEKRTLRALHQWAQV